MSSFDVSEAELRRIAAAGYNVARVNQLLCDGWTPDEVADRMEVNGCGPYATCLKFIHAIPAATAAESQPQ